MTISRRAFLEASAAAAGATGLIAQAEAEAIPHAVSPRFAPVPLRGNTSLHGLANEEVSEALKRRLERATQGSLVSWGIPFEVGTVLFLKDKPVEERIGPLKAQWICFLHTSDVEPLEWNEQGFLSPTRGEGRLPEHVADYVIVYGDGSEERVKIRRRHQIGMLQRRWGELCFQAVPQNHPYPIRPLQEQRGTRRTWGLTQTRAVGADLTFWNNWVWAWENPRPETEIRAFRFEPRTGETIISAVSVGSPSAFPLRWESRRKALLKLPEGADFDYDLDEVGLMKQIRLDMGQVISAQPAKIYPHDSWDETYDNQVPEISRSQVQVEYTAHPDALFHLEGGITVPVSELTGGRASGRLTPIFPGNQRVKIRVVERGSRQPVAVKLHLHGESGEYLPPLDHHRIPNATWFEDYGAEYLHQRRHFCAYIPGEALVDLPVGNVYLEVSKGFEMRPVRKVIRVRPDTESITVEIEKVFNWREKNWVTADTHVHFLSPQTALLEGKAEGVNVVNLLASQWGELMTNVGDFDGKTTFGSREAGGDGEWLVRVGTENRQHVLGHISLLGYGGNIIAPMCAAGPPEAALGDPVDALLMEWAQKCRAQGGLVVIPHFPNPRAESAADLVNGDIDAVEMTSLGNPYGGIDPYFLSDYYRYLNCGYFVPVVGGTDKMSAIIEVGAIRTYTRIPDDEEFTYETCITAVKSGNTFITYGPLLEFSVEGEPAGSRLQMSRGGGSVDVTWKLASVTVPMSRVELVINGEIRESRAVGPGEDSGHWSVSIDRSSWVALLVRGHYLDKTEVITAHTSPVMIEVAGSEFHAAADAVTILEQIEGALVFLDTVGTRAEDRVYRRMRLKLTSVYRKLHDELHSRGVFHEHSEPMEHEH